MKSILIPIIFLICLSNSIIAQSLCRFNSIDCINGCGRFVDNNGDGFCDLGLLSKLLKVNDTSKIVSDTSKVVTNDTIKVNDAKVFSNNETKANKIVIETKNYKQSTIDSQQTNDTAKIVIVADNQDNQNNSTNSKKEKKKPYDLISISLATFALYLFTLFLSKKKVISKRSHRQVWNVILLTTFLVSCLFGFFLVIQINYHFALKIIKTIIYWHVQVGIAMTLIAVFHFLWHLKYYLNMLKSKNLTIQ